MSYPNQLSSRVWRGLSEWFTLGLLALSLTLNVYMVWQYRGASSPSRLEVSGLKVGDKLPILRVHDLGGSTATLDWTSDHRSTLIYVFSPKCHWCARNLENIKFLNSALHSDYRIVGISLSEEGLAKYVKENKVPFAVYADPRQMDNREFVLGGTPQTLIVSPDARVREVWRGAYTGKVQKEIEAKLRLQLPGLSPDPG